MRNLTNFKGVYLTGLALMTICCWLMIPATNSYAQRSTPVTVVNPVDNPVPVTVTNAYPREPINIKTTIGSSGEEIMVVPDDAYLVIETVSVRVLSTEILEEVKVNINIDGGYQKPNIRYYVPISSDLTQGGSASTGYVGTQNMRVYVGPGIQVVAEISRRPQSGSQIAEVSLSGYLLPLDSPTLSP